MFLENRVEFSFSNFNENFRKRVWLKPGEFSFFILKIWKTVKITFLIYIQFGKLKIFIFLENFGKLNEPNAFSEFPFFLENFPRKLEKFPQPNAP